jgi:hypothetical protein
MKSGFIYVLINPSMPGIISIGRTDGDPAEKAKELSTACGVPTPFIPIYKKFFRDCISAEISVHNYLDQRGARLSQGKSFFTTDPTEAIDLITIISDEQRNPDIRKPRPPVAPNTTQRKPDSVAPPPTTTNEESIQSLIKLGLDHESGRGQTPQDIHEAIRCYEKAAKLGSATAHVCIGLLYHEGRKINPDRSKAKKSFNEAIRIDPSNESAYAHLAWIFFRDGELENHFNCVTRELELGNERFIRKPSWENLNQQVNSATGWLKKWHKHKTRVPRFVYAPMSIIKNLIIESISQDINFCVEPYKTHCKEILKILPHTIPDSPNQFSYKMVPEELSFDRFMNPKK